MRTIHPLLDEYVEKPERSVYTPQDFLQWRETSSLDLTPKFQRRAVWTAAARSFFIDTLLRQLPVPPIYIRVTQSEDRRRAVRQIIDGQQRISCVLDYLNGKFRLSRTIPGSWAGKSFEELSGDEKENVTTHPFSCEIFHGISDAAVLEVFARLNTYNVALNSQELRNGRFFGIFKQSVYALAHEHLEFWRQQQIFSERSIARMVEVEFTSELIIAQMSGMQDKKKSIDQFYRNYDDRYQERQINENRFRSVIDSITDTFDGALKDTEFVRVPLFYTLYCLVYHCQHGLPNVDLPTSRRELSRSQRFALVEAVQNLSELIGSGREGEAITGEAGDFVEACLRQTDNIKPRLDRLNYLHKEAFGE